MAKLAIFTITMVFVLVLFGQLNGRKFANIIVPRVAAPRSVSISSLPANNVDPNFRQNRQSMAYRFGDGIEYLIPNIHETFSCQHREYGYYADLDNNCQIFHVCVPPEQQFSFFCPNQTIFDQRLLICQDQYTATPCQDAERFYVVNENFGVIGENKLSLDV